MRRLRNIIFIMFAFFCAFLFKNTAFAATNITYQTIDGTPILNSAGTNLSDSTASLAYTNLNTELAPGGTLAGKTVLAYMYNGVRSATNPTVFSGAAFAENYTVTVVFAEDVTANGAIGVGGAVWFVHNNKLYITGTPAAIGSLVTISDTTYTATISYVDQTETKSLTGTSFKTKYPLFFYSDLDGNDSGILDSEIYNEMHYAANEWYKFRATSDPSYDLNINDRADIVLDYRLEGHNTAGTLDPLSVGWINLAPSITDIYISDDIELVGNMNGLFNANFTYIKENGSNNDMKDSVYRSLKNVYLYCDMSKVEAAAGMFGLIPSLENIYVRNGVTSVPMPLVKSLAYMFYGDTKLTNGTDSFINAIDLSGANTLISTSYMFAGCEQISKPNVRTYRMNNVKFAEGMFFGAKNMQLVSDGSGADFDISGWNLTSLVNAVAMFSGGDADDTIEYADPLLKMDPGLSDISSYGNVITGTVDMTNWSMTNVKMTTLMFSKNGENFVGVTFGANYPSLIDASAMFLRCDYMRNVTMQNTSMPALENATSMFRLAGSKASVGNADISGWNVPNLVHAEFMFYGTGFTTIDTTNISSLSKLKYAECMFAENTKLTSLGAGAMSSVVFGSLEEAQMMFMNDSALVKVDTSKWKMPKVKNLDFAFQNTPSLTSGLDISGWGVTSALTSMECFANKNGMDTFDCSAWDLRNVNQLAFAFSDNPNLTQVKMPTAATALMGARSVCGIFSDDPKLVSANLPQGGSILLDCMGVFANDTSLASPSVVNLVGSSVTDVSYFFKNCSSLTSIDISGWNTSSVRYIQGACDNNNKLASISLGTGVTGVNILDAGTLLRNCYVLPDNQINSVIAGFTTAGSLVDAYEMFKNCYALTSLDMSQMNFSQTKELRRIAAMDENAAYTTNRLTTIKVPASILTAAGVVLKDTDGTSINLFWVDGDGVADGNKEEDTDSDDLLTTLFVNGTPGSNFLAYALGGTNSDNDNRALVKYNARTINDKDVGTYQIADSSDEAVMKIDATSTFYTGGSTASTATLVPLSYSWMKDTKAISGATEDSYKSAKSGTYVAQVKPSLFTSDNTKRLATFVIGKNMVGITATYNGKDITVGKDFSVDDLTVKLVDSDGNEFALTTNDFTVDSKTVTKQGNNTFTITYTSGTTKFTTPVTIKGVRNIGSVVATYSGPAVLVGKNFDPTYVKLFAYYTDDTAKKEGFEVSPTSFSSQSVTAVGDNVFTAYYKDTAQDTTFNSTFKVNGYKSINSISATYTGDAVKVGEKFDRDKVKVTLYYADGSGSSTTSNFTLDSQTLYAEGGNTFTASYRDPFGNIYTSGFSVPGYKDQTNNNNVQQNQVPYANNATGLTTSTVVAPQTQASSSAANIKTGTSTGVVQTGRTDKAILYIVAIIALLALIIFTITKRNKGR